MSVENELVLHYYNLRLELKPREVKSQLLMTHSHRFTRPLRLLCALIGLLDCLCFYFNFRFTTVN